MIVPHEGHGGCAFPQDATTGNLEEWRFGMSLRDYFAAKALHTLYFDTSLNDDTAEVQSMARLAYMLADAMLAERAK